MEKNVQHYASRPHRADDTHPGRAYDCPICAPKYAVKPLMDKRATYAACKANAH